MAPKKVAKQFEALTPAAQNIISAEAWESKILGSEEYRLFQRIKLMFNDRLCKNSKYWTCCFVSKLVEQKAKEKPCGLAAI